MFQVLYAVFSEPVKWVMKNTVSEQAKVVFVLSVAGRKPGISPERLLKSIKSANVPMMSINSAPRGTHGFLDEV